MLLGVRRVKHIMTSILKACHVFFPFFWFEITIHSTPYMNGRATTLGVFKAYVVFFFFSFIRVDFDGIKI